MLDFEPKTGFSVSETSEIREEVAQDWVNAFKETGRPDLNTDPETPQEPAQPAKTEEKEKGFFENVGDFFKKIGSGISKFFKGLFGG